MRFKRPALILVLALRAACVQAGPSLPDTPAAKAFGRWLAAFNAANREDLQAFLTAYHRKNPVEDELDFRQQTGGFDLLTVQADKPDEVDAVVQERDADQALRITMVVDPTDPMRLTRWALQGVPLPAGHEIPRLAATQVFAQATQKLQAFAKADRFSGMVLAVHDGQRAFEFATGEEDRDLHVPVSAATRFRIGSMNKMFTAVAVLQLVEAGKLRLDGHVGDYLKDYPNAEVARGVTVRELLSHTGGTGDIFGKDFDTHRESLRTLQDYVDLYGTRAPAFEPGSRDAYSNYGFILLGRIVEAVSGQSYYDYVDQHVFAPAGMTATGSLPESIPVTHRAAGYMRNDADTQWVRCDATLPWRGTSAGGGYTTAEDLVRFAQALVGGKLVSKALLAEATRAQNHGGWYGYGFMLHGDGAAHDFGHDGGAPGMEASMLIYPEAGWIVVGLSNMSAGTTVNIVQFIGNRVPLGDTPPAARASGAGAAVTAASH